MAEFSREKAKTKNIYYRRLLAGGLEKYERQPFNLIEYDDNSGSYLEPVSYHGMSSFTWSDVNTLATAAEIWIIDTNPSWMGVTEIT